MRMKLYNLMNLTNSEGLGNRYLMKSDLTEMFGLPHATFDYVVAFLGLRVSYYYCRRTTHEELGKLQ